MEREVALSVCMIRIGLGRGGKRVKEGMEGGAGGGVFGINQREHHIAAIKHTRQMKREVALPVGVIMISLGRGEGGGVKEEKWKERGGWGSASIKTSAISQRLKMQTR
jgi:hypothetical protein